MSRSYKVGILHSLVGTMADSEKPLVDAARLAIEEINATRGASRQVRSRPSWPTGAPSRRRSDARRGGSSPRRGSPRSSAAGLRPPARRSGARSKPPGGSSGTPSSTKASRSPRTSSTRAARSTSRWSPRWTGRSPSSDSRFFLVGSDYVYPRTANRLAKALLLSHGGTVSGEALVPLGSVDFSDVIQRLQDAGPLVVFSTINGDSNVAFYRQLAAARLSPSRYPVLAMSVAETELVSIGESARGHLACWGYFQSLKSEANRKFIAAYRARFGAHRSTSDPIAAAHTQVHLWAEAVRKAGSFEPADVARAAPGCRLASPLGEHLHPPQPPRHEVGHDRSRRARRPDPRPLGERQPLRAPSVARHRAGRPDQRAGHQGGARRLAGGGGRRPPRAAPLGRSAAERARSGSGPSSRPPPSASPSATPPGRYLQVNERFREITGFSEAELLATTFQEITHPDDLAAELELVRRLVAGETERCSMEKRYVRKDGTVRWVQLTFSVVRRPEGGADTFIGDRRGPRVAQAPRGRGRREPAASRREAGAGRRRRRAGARSR